jgi:hypothetical protein
MNGVIPAIDESLAQRIPSQYGKFGRGAPYRVVPRTNYDECVGTRCNRYVTR